SGIGERFGVRVSEIKHWNKLRNDHIDVGELLKLYVTPARRARYEGENDGPPVTNEAPDAPSATFTWYTVRKGDSLYAIAKRHPGVSPEDLMRYNGISDGIRPGQRIKIPAQR
ncbi:MAG TPA: LysM peptidoglycan-binding domain-containing protein, partial [Flavobacteriales bacterium]|nr:LysM peptidoglycan-binding domain-containing protein [Flavobacteriales bacterium]